MLKNRKDKKKLKQHTTPSGTKSNKKKRRNKGNIA